jgi:DNA-binding NarL/FixJ family response regulator
LQTHPPPAAVPVLAPAALPIGTQPRPALVVSESEILRAGLTALAPQAGLEVVGALATATGVEVAAREHTAEVVLAAPIRAADEAFYAALRRLPKGCHALVLLAVPGFRVWVGELRRRHGLACLPLDADRIALQSAVDELTREHSTRGLMVEHLAVGPGGALTMREQEVLHELAQGMPNRAIAARLVVSEDTVKSHLRRVYRKLGVRTRAEAVAMYLGEIASPA